LIGGFRSRLSAVHVNHRRVAAGATVIGALTIFAKFFVAAREMAIAWRFGVSGLVDAYQLALTITTWLPMMITSVMTVVLVPRLVSLRLREEDYRSFIAELNGTVILLGIAVMLLALVAAPAVSAFLASDANHNTLELTSSMSQLMAPVALFSISIGYLSARLQSRERFAYTVTEAVPAITIGLFTALLLGDAGPRTLVMGTLVGFVLQAATLCIMTGVADAGIGSIRLRHRSVEWRSLYGSALVMTAAQVTLALIIPIDQAFAARLGLGAVATLGYANRIVTLFCGIGTIVVGRALLPVLSGTVADGELNLGRRQALQWSILLGAAAAVGSIAVWIVAPDIVRLLFERGAFGPAASTNVAGALRWGLLQLPFYFAGIALVQWYAATVRFRAILGITACALLFKIASNLFLTPRFGVPGIMISTAIMYMVTAILLFLLTVAPKWKACLSAVELRR